MTRQRKTRGCLNSQQVTTSDQCYAYVAESYQICKLNQMNHHNLETLLCLWVGYAAHCDKSLNLLIFHVLTFESILQPICSFPPCELWGKIFPRNTCFHGLLDKLPTTSVEKGQLTAGVSCGQQRWKNGTKTLQWNITNKQ